MSGNRIDGALGRRAFFTKGLARALGQAADALGEGPGGASWMRPPGALPERAFVAACTRCGACASACPPKAIRFVPATAGLAAGTPMLEVALTACTMCPDMPCATACPTDALMLPEQRWAGTLLAALLVDETRCLAHRDVACGICARVCPIGERALALDQRGRPIVGDACTGCGMCIDACVTTPSSLAAEPPARRSA